MRRNKIKLPTSLPLHCTPEASQTYKNTIQSSESINSMNCKYITPPNITPGGCYIWGVYLSFEKQEMAHCLVKKKTYKNFGPNQLSGYGTNHWECMVWLTHLQGVTLPEKGSPPPSFVTLGCTLRSPLTPPPSPVPGVALKVGSPRPLGIRHPGGTAVLDQNFGQNKK